MVANSLFYSPPPTVISPLALPPVTPPSPSGAVAGRLSFFQSLPPT